MQNLVYRSRISNNIHVSSLAEFGTQAEAFTQVHICSLHARETSDELEELATNSRQLSDLAKKLQHFGTLYPHMGPLNELIKIFALTDCFGRINSNVYFYL
jgi:hypothetical protein